MQYIHVVIQLNTCIIQYPRTGTHRLKTDKTIAVIVYGPETWSLILRDDRELKYLNSMLRELYTSKRQYIKKGG
jgi:hypothetical protein